MNTERFVVRPESSCRGQSFTSKRRTADQAPGVPEAALARTRHHVVSTGKALVENCEAVTVGDSTSGAPNESESAWGPPVAHFARRLEVRAGLPRRQSRTSDLT